MLLAKCQEERLKGSTQHQLLVTFTDRGGLNTVYRGALNPSPGRVTPCVIEGSPKQARHMCPHWVGSQYGPTNRGYDCDVGAYELAVFKCLGF